MRRTALPAPDLPPGRRNLVLTGFMGTGKTAAGRRAADLLGRPFVDLDAVIARRAGAQISHIFAQEGEPAFRGLERVAVTDAARLSGAVIATGGGAVLDRGAFDGLARTGAVLALWASTDELERRLAGDATRPLLAAGDTRQRIHALLAERAATYAAVGEILDTTGREVESVASEIARRAETAGAERVPVRAGDASYAVVVARGAVERAGAEVRAACPDARLAAVVADAAVTPIAERVASSLRAAGLACAGPLAIEGGEASKDAATAALLWRRFLEAGLERGDVVVAVGGGATLDVAGFAAGTYMRGVAVANVPTTLLAMVDAGIGGKVGIDHAGTKNLVGAFHQPLTVIVDPDLLATLGPRDARAGLAEVVKAAVLASPLLLDVLATLPLEDGLPARLDWIVEQAVRVKAAYVSADPRDRDVRRSLNLGHTFAHAIEAASGFAVPHGEAVAIGLVAASRLGARHGDTPPQVEPRVREVLERLGLPTTAPPALRREDLLRAMAGDKKRSGGEAAFVVPAIGGAELLVGIDPAEALEALA